MAAKFDAEMLKKHHFWFLFIPVGIALLIAWYALFIEVPDAISGTAAQHETKSKALVYQAKSRGLVDEYKKNVTKLDTERVKKWKEAWEEQKDLFVWPSGYSEKQLAVVKDLKFGAAISDALSTRRQFEGHYQEEYKKLIKELEPMQFRGRWEDMLRYKEKFGRVPDSEDMWLAMEDLWVQREILRRVAEVNTAAARFEIVRAEDSKDDPKHRIFKSRNWQLDLKMTEKDTDRRLEGTLTNISPRLLVMGVGNRMILKVWLTPDAKSAFPFEIQGGAVNAGETISIKPIEAHKIPADWRATELARVEQEFDIRTVPIKRVEHFGLGKLSDRNHHLSLKMSKFSEALAKTQAPPTSGNPTTTTVGMPTMGMPTTGMPPPSTGMGTPPTGYGMGGDNQATADDSQNGLKRSRYIDVTDQVRRMPFAIALVTEQTYVKDIIESLANTKLRFQTTQVDWTRYHRELSYTVGTTSGNVGRLFGPGMGTGLDYGSAPTTSREDQFSANLLELNIYGIVSVYERFKEEGQPKEKLPEKKPAPPEKQPDKKPAPPMMPPEPMPMPPKS
jgi:hypothetical protein